MNNKMHFIIIGIGLSAILMSGCGGGGTSNETQESAQDTSQDMYQDITQSTDQDTVQEVNQDTVQDVNQTSDDNNDSIVAGYAAGDGILIETRSDGTKRAWVNSRTNACLIYRLSEHPGTTILEGGRAHCADLNNLKYAGITTWRMPDEDEAVYLMSHVSTTGNDRIIYPDNNPNCQYMATTSSVDGREGRFVYTTNNPNQGAFNNFDVQGKTRTTAGIRCVADQ